MSYPGYCHKNVVKFGIIPDNIIKLNVNSSLKANCMIFRRKQIEYTKVKS